MAYVAVLKSNKALPLLVVLFAGSGCAALIYELVWFQFLQLIVGSSAVSLAMLLASYMGGMCLGSLALPRLPAPYHPLRIYAWLEIGIAFFGVLILWTVPYLSGVVAAICLLPPTILMGASLPAAARWVETTPRGISWMGFFYAGNIAGGVAGDLLAGFYLLRVHDVAFATYVAVSINLAVALGAFALARWAGKSETANRSVQRRPFTVFLSPVYLVIGLSGLSALGAEVVWTRLLSLMLGANVYTFSIILAVFLIGLGLGSALGSLIAREGTQPKAAFAYCQ